MLLKDMKNTIKFAIEKDIESIRTKLGYNGAPILEISSNSLLSIKEIKKWCNNLGYETKTFNKQDVSLPEALQIKGYNIFCIFGEDKYKEKYIPLK